MDLVAPFDLLKQRAEVPVEPDVAHTTWEDIEKSSQCLFGEPFARDAVDENRCSRCTKSMLRTCEIILSNFDVHAKLSVKYCADPDDNQNRHEQVCAISTGVAGLDVAPGQGIQTSDCSSGIASFLTRVDILSTSIDVVDWDKNREHDAADRYKDDEQRPKVSKEEVGVEAAFLNDLAVRKLKQILEQAKHAGWRAGGSLAFGYKVGFGFARED